MSANDIPDEHHPSSPPADTSRSVLDNSMSPAWREAYDYIRELQALAILGEYEARGTAGSPERVSILKATTAASKAFRAVYEEESTRAIAREIENRDL